jgi:hypothetical protein
MEISGSEVRFGGSKRAGRCGLVVLKGCREAALVALSVVTTCCAFVSPIVRR